MVRNGSLHKYSTKSFYSPLTTDYIEFWNYLNRNYGNKSATMRLAILRYIYDHVEIKEREGTSNEEDLAMKEIIMKILKMEKLTNERRNQSR